MLCFEIGHVWPTLGWLWQTWAGLQKLRDQDIHSSKFRSQSALRREVCVEHLPLSTGSFAVDAALAMCCLNDGDKLERQGLGDKEDGMFNFSAGPRAAVF